MANGLAPNPALSARFRDRRFYLFITLLAAALVFAGFARTFYLNGLFAKLHLPSLFIVHGVVFSSWLVILVTQVFLVSARRIRIHKTLGYASIAIVIAMFSLGWIMSVDAAQRVEHLPVLTAASAGPTLAHTKAGSRPGLCGFPQGGRHAA